MYFNFIQHAAILVAMSTLYNLVTRLYINNPHLKKFLPGLLFGLIGLASMMMPYQYAPGIIYDGLSIILTLAGLYGGGTTIFIAGLMRPGHIVLQSVEQESGPGLRPLLYPH